MRGLRVGKIGVVAAGAVMGFCGGAACGSVWVSVWGRGAGDACWDTGGERFIFPYFQSNGETGVFLAVSTDGFDYREANFKQRVFFPPQWENGQNLTRDPSICYHEGVYHMVWTSNWSGDIMGYAHSTDLMNWSEPQKIRPFAGWDEVPKNVWAPEIDYNPARDAFFIVYSSTLPSELNDGDGSEDQHGNDHRPYIIYTTDFETYSDPEVYIDPGYSTIDSDQWFDDRGTEATDDDRWVMVFKNEQATSVGGKSLHLAFRDPMMEGPWDVREGAIVGTGSPIRANEVAEGPGILYDGEKWILYWDSYGNGHYSVATSTDLETWTDHTDELRSPVSHLRHGTPFLTSIDTLTVPMPMRAAPGKLLNGDMESVLEGTPLNWGSRAWSGEADFAYDAEGGRSGGAAIRISSGGGADAAWSTYASVDPGTAYRLKGWIRTSGLDRGTGLGAQLNVHEHGGAVTESVLGDSGWTYVETEFTTGVLEREVQINCLLGGWGRSSGTVWFDDLVLEPSCPPDLDGSGALDVDDVLVFLRAFAAGE